ncbi:SUMF1/EgtB/PvdO family nonheme iron enzyme [Brenneria populi]|uniref:SUMF1/EgtB/PvdO family nonheme iron enzyme n=1 Tax=Brenneria populi TaxID=1505588 RepID=A0ABU6JW77_9GAMM|nr:SUMF1/EgtB/PvdO family nonheme iron enzyme [Brenneria populi Li et al. 2015]
MLKLFLLSPIALIFIVGCNPSGQAENNSDIKNLVKRSLDNMVNIQGGSFEMGDFGIKIGEKLPLTGDVNDQPLHKVTLSDFSISKYKITYRDYDVYTSATGKKKLDPGSTLELSKKFRDPDVAAALNWQQSRDYCQWLGKQANKKIDLPTEAQWEFVARNRGQYVVYATDSGKYEEGHNIPTSEQKMEIMGFNDFNIPVGKLPPTPLGIYDMAGNGTDWVIDWYDADYYKYSPENDPQGPDSGNEKVYRGFQMGAGAMANQTIFRQFAAPDIDKDKDYVVPTRNARCVIN